MSKRVKHASWRHAAKLFVANPYQHAFAVVRVVSAATMAEGYELLFDREEFRRMATDPTTQEYQVLWSRDLGITPEGRKLLASEE